MCVCVMCGVFAKRSAKKKEIENILNCEFCEWKTLSIDTTSQGIPQQQKRIAELIQLKKTLVNWKTNSEL